MEELSALARQRGTGKTTELLRQATLLASNGCQVCFMVPNEFMKLNCVRLANASGLLDGFTVQKHTSRLIHVSGGRLEFRLPNERLLEGRRFDAVIQDHTVNVDPELLKRIVRVTA